MTTKMPSLRNFRNPIGCLILLAALGAAAGCSTAESPSGSGTNMNHVLPSGNSVSVWVVVPSGGSHASTATLDYIANGGSSGCAQCHGSDLSGGISGVSCFGNPAGCHHDPVSGWDAVTPAAQQHGISAKKAPGSSGFASCQICHGSDFSGGGAKVSCFTCHGVSAPHPARPWHGPTYTHADTDTSNATVCAQCHFPGSPNNPANHPATPAPAGTPPGCFNNTMCHGSTGAPHPVPYNAPSHYVVTAATFPANCSACHDISAPTVKPGPACQTCHVAGSPLVALNCTSCHASPPNGGPPAGATYPNIAGAHNTHIALNSAGTPISCGTCHSGLTSGTLNHYNRAKSRVPPGDVLFLATYNAQSGSSSFDNSAALSCSNVSCHGGQATPNWRTGAIDVNTQCTSCHTTITTTQFNGPTSSNHNRSDHQVACTACHNTTALAVNHFTNLATPALEGPASATIIPGSTSTGGFAIVSYVPATRSCTPSCHQSSPQTW